MTKSIPAFQHYQAQTVEMSRTDLFDQVNQRMYHGYGPPAIARGAPVAAYPLAEYEHLLSDLAAMPRVECVTHAQMCTQPIPDDRIWVAIRHDVDGDLVASYQMALLEHQYGARTSHYFLHTAYYYGHYARASLQRYGAMARLLVEMEDLGQEISLHTDGLSVYQQFGMDGAAAVRTEIEWMRSLGLSISGTCAHGSTAAFGAENFEIFKGRRRGQRRDESLRRSDEPSPFTFNGMHALRYVIDEVDIGLAYECNDIFSQTNTPVAYGATRAVDGWRWNPYLADREQLKENPGLPLFCTQDRVVRDIASLKPPCFVVLVVHPCYYGARHAPDRAPIRRLNRSSRVVNPELGWLTHPPLSVQCLASDGPGRRTTQTIQWSNSLGMLDADPPWEAAAGEADVRVLMLGSQNVHGERVASPSQLHRVLQGMLAESIGRPVQCVKCSGRTMGVSRYAAWLEPMFERYRPTHLLIDVNSQALRFSVPAIWSVEEGLSRHHPPGRYLGWRDGGPEWVEASSGWELRRRKPRMLTRWPDTGQPLADMLATGPPYTIDGFDAWRYLVECYRWVVDAARRKGATPILCVSESGERYGWGAPSAGDRRREAFMDRMAALADEVDAPLIDPACGFAAPFPEAVGAALDHDRWWTAVGHRLAARHAARELARLGAVPAFADRVDASGVSGQVLGASLRISQDQPEPRMDL